MLSFTKKNNIPTPVAAQTVELASSSVVAYKESSSSSSVKKNIFHRASRRVQKMLGLKKSVAVAQLAPEPRVVFELGPASDPYRNHARLSPSSSISSAAGADHTRTTTTHHINRFSRYDSLLPVVVIPPSASVACPALSPTSSFSSSLESASPSTPSLTSLNEAAHHRQGTDADKKMKMMGLTRADRVRRRPAPAFSRSHTSSSSSSSSANSDSPSSFSIWTIVPASVTNSSFVGRPWEEKKKGLSTGEGEVQGVKGYSREAVAKIRKGAKEVGAERCAFVVSQVPVGVLEGECEVVVEWM